MKVRKKRKMIKKQVQLLIDNFKIPEINKRVPIDIEVYKDKIREQYGNR